MKRSMLYFLWSLLISSVGGRALLATPLPLSLKESVKMALLNNADVINARLNEEIQNQQKNLYITEMFPQVKYNIQTTYFSKIRKAFLPDFVTPSISNFLANAGVKNSAGQPINPVSFNPTQGILINANQPWNTFQDVTIQQILFEPNVLIALASVKSLRKLAEANTQMAEETLKDQVMRLYFTLLILQQRKVISDSLYERVQILSEQTRVLVQNGFLESIDEERMQLNVSKMEAIRQQLYHAWEVARVAFVQLIGIDKRVPFFLDYDLHKWAEIEEGWEEGITRYTNRADYKSLSIAYDLKKLDFKSKELAYLPTLTFIGNIGHGDITNKFFISSHFGKQGFANDFWGVRLSLDVFGGMKKRFQFRKTQLELQQTENTLCQTRELIDVDIERKQKDYLNAWKNVQLWQRNKELSERVCQHLQVRYANGLIRSFDMLTATSEWESVVDKYYEALLTFLLARIGWRRAIGQLNSLL